MSSKPLHEIDLYLNNVPAKYYGVPQNFNQQIIQCELHVAK